ncbi:Rap1a/Tai family immunity protein [Brevundimonas lenta]|uniref:Rap1a immunity protein domain-containing protein n=1 Tax=Brevundimonas lenta TaxID=424796 RepID=A0A7W6NNG1_9CAUL|nr:Rap1a/Tai family immunity protein [Brevundimonas lenta]MBB4081424.1 hypothetical protein [Brevundimonas lenta]
MGQYQRATGEQKLLLDFYVSAVADGYQWANAAMANNGDVPLFCLPPRMALTDEQLTDILDRWLESLAGQTDEQDYLAMEVLLALKNTFPCAEEPFASVP